MRTTFFFPFVALILFASPVLAQLRVSNNPTGAAVVITQSSAVAVTWSVQSGSTVPATAVSEEGLFVLGLQTLGRVDTFLTAPVNNGTGSVNETLLIPPDVTNRAYKLGAATFFYRRVFRDTASGATGQSDLTCRLATSAYGNFSLAAITLYFDNQRGEATFEQNDQQAHAFAEIHYNGTGLLKGSWDVQEPNTTGFRVLQQVNYHLTYGDRIVFQSPSVPPLPTIVTGRYTLRFIVTEPVAGFPLPTVTYFVKVKPTEEAATVSPLKLESPADNSTVGKELSFRWSGAADKAALLKLTVSEKTSLNSIVPVSPSSESLPDSHPLSGSRILQTPELLAVKGVDVFSAALPASATQYSLRPEQLERLRGGVMYVWQVQALDAKGVALFSTELHSFQYKPAK